MEEYGRIWENMGEYGRIDVHRLTSKRLKLESKLAFINQL